MSLLEAIASLVLLATVLAAVVQAIVGHRYRHRVTHAILRAFPGVGGAALRMGPGPFD